MEPVNSLLQSFFIYAEYLLPTVWITLGCTVAWYVLSAKRPQELTSQETEILWKSHKQFNHCSANFFTSITKNEKIFGYICECGYKHQQERPIINLKQ